MAIGGLIGLLDDIAALTEVDRSITGRCECRRWACDGEGGWSGGG